MPGMRSSAATKCISLVPGFEKQTSTPDPSREWTRLSAPFMTLLPPMLRDDAGAAGSLPGLSAQGLDTRVTPDSADRRAGDRGNAPGQQRSTPARPYRGQAERGDLGRQPACAAPPRCGGERARLSRDAG